MKKTSSILVETVIPLSASQEKTLGALLKKKFGTDEFSTKLQPTLLGGVRVTVGSTQYDASVQGKLLQLKTGQA